MCFMDAICMSLTLDQCPILWCFKHSNVIKRHNGIIFSFHTGLPGSFELKSYFILFDVLKHITQSAELLLREGLIFAS